ncbi:lytic murein transglycosylase [Lutimaribacter sp. EGI FJ00015]|uniref:Lytic murein transglycosylase n=1 Tax=Lutimaribacter degradans TaxID=2945989 RepID=A0ACC5ZXL8_9RHOB|nr:lytic murein transglycosylase [Lutimaribacter sp. EGI FJ00013]MCM2563081.1 lytic murein transglycosylase [Lutimaribacter sp. EGI FJ00013]MCO0614260.1 lytic murein transglycosylase [Lutimaribacter sp. EGI FJ00015]MCO0637070.1 lytic murein transglycosylase [Lutimaribacter sp. EGI FJ00014]
MRTTLLAAALSLAAALPAAAQQAQCGGSWSDFVEGVAQEAIAQGRDPAAVQRFTASLRQDQKVLAADRRQGVFQLDFTTFARRLISTSRLQKGQQMAREWASTFDRVQARFGVPPGVLLAFWAFETDYGAFQGDFNTANALATLAHDCRRPELFRPQLLAAIQLYEMGDFDPARTTGAWAGEIGMVQMLPRDIIENGVDGDGDGHVRLKTSAPDALMSGGKMLQHLGWRAGEPWLQEVRLPAQMDWSQSGLNTTLRPDQWQAMGVRPRSGQWQAELPASLILPQGHKGPAFIAYPNFNVYFEWNQSFTYVLTAAYFATRLSGAPVFEPGTPDTGLSGEQMKELQRKLEARGHDVGGIDGILGAGTRAAVRAEQARLGLPVDAWPTRELVNRL